MIEDINKSEIRIIIAGGRDFHDYDLAKQSFIDFCSGLVKPDGSDFYYDELTIISGMAVGADMIGVRLSKEFNTQLIKCPANWDRYGRGAGYIRNREMAYKGTHLLAFWDGKSKGTENMINEANKHTLFGRVIHYNNGN